MPETVIKFEKPQKGRTSPKTNNDFEYVAGHSNVILDHRTGDVKVMSKSGDYSLGSIPQVLRVMRCDDAPEGSTVHYEVKTAGMPDAVTLTEGKLEEKSWAFELDGLTGMHNKENRTKYANAIDHVARKIQTEFAKYRSGFHSESSGDESVYFYLTQHARLFGNAQPSRIYSLVDAASDFRTTPLEKPDKATITRMISDLMRITPDGQAMLILLVAFSSPLAFIKPESKRQGFMAFCAGRGGSGKTGTANLGRATIRPYEESGHDTTFRASRNGLEPILGKKQHQPVLIDDLEEFDADNKGTLAQLLNINKTAYDGGALRNRSTRRSTQAATSTVAFNPIVTSEFIPEFNNAFFRRTLLVPFGEEFGCQPIRAITTGESLGMEEYYKLQDVVRATYDQLIIWILNKCNAGQMAEAGKAFCNDAEICAKDFSDVEPDSRPHYHIQPARSVMRIAGELLAVARLLDDICETGRAWYKAAAAALEFSLEFQLNRMQANERALMDGALLDEVIHRYFEAIADSRAEDRHAQHITIDGAHSESLSKHPFDNQAIYSWLDKPKNIFLLATGGRELFCATAERVFGKHFSEDALWSYFEMNGLTVKRESGRQRTVKHGLSNGSGRPRGWLLKADKFAESLDTEGSEQQ